MTEIGVFNPTLNGENRPTLTKLNCYRQLFSVISQDIYLFRDTLRNNILLGKKMTDSQLWQIIEELKLEKFIQSLPQGLNTILDRNGGNLSGGERQKVAFIRAIVKDAKIIIMDEATSNIDRIYDSFIHNYIFQKCNNKTVIIVTHKAENLENLDKIYEIKCHKIQKK